MSEIKTLRGLSCSCFRIVNSHVYRAEGPFSNRLWHLKDEKETQCNMGSSVKLSEKISSTTSQKYWQNKKSYQPSYIRQCLCQALSPVPPDLSEKLTLLFQIMDLMQLFVCILFPLSSCRHAGSMSTGHWPPANNSDGPLVTYTHRHTLGFTLHAGHVGLHPHVEAMEGWLSGDTVGALLVLRNYIIDLTDPRGHREMIHSVDGGPGVLWYGSPRISPVGLGVRVGDLGLGFEGFRMHNDVQADRRFQG